MATGADGRLQAVADLRRAMATVMELCDVTLFGLPYDRAAAERALPAAMRRLEVRLARALAAFERG